MIYEPPPSIKLKLSTDEAVYPHLICTYLLRWEEGPGVREGRVKTETTEHTELPISLKPHLSPPIYLSSCHSPTNHQNQPTLIPERT